MRRAPDRPSGPQSLTTLLTSLHLATTLRMRALQVESPKCGVSPHFHRKGVFIGRWESSTDLEKSVWHQVEAGWPTGWSGLHRLSPLPWPSSPCVDTCPRSRGQTVIKHGRPAKEFGWPAGLWALSAWGLDHSVHVSNTPPW
jgi:hypothetical protein